ncbi:MAG: hypothetical protein COB15_13915 [Flavobacteriales bacterium]|nr:MAG: hypothetical protein COB15_13915 [Flavobacteriales bacterium]
METDFLQSAITQFKHYKAISEKTINLLPEDKLFWQINKSSNSIAIIVKHLSGNMLSRWTDFLTTDGEKEWRNRDQEFEASIKTKKELLEKWEEGWKCLFDTLNNLTIEDIKTKTIYIRNEKHSITEAINRQLAHYPYHIGQIIYIGKMVSEDWNTLTIPKGGSKEHNDEMFSKPKS